MLPRLITIPISHYGERARWALDLAGRDYQESHHLQLFSWVASRWHGGTKTLPILVLPDGSVLCDSADIVRYAEQQSPGVLFSRDPTERQLCETLAQSFAQDYGVETRRVGYEWFFRVPEVSLAYNRGHAPAWQGLALHGALPLTRRIAHRVLDISPDKVSRGLSLVNRTLDSVAKTLSDGRPYLCGERFTAADLSFAAMSAPSLLPERYGLPLPRPEELPPDARERVLRWREHPAGRFALKLYDARPTPRGQPM